jgi:fructosamine-3-kinase
MPTDTYVIGGSRSQNGVAGRFWALNWGSAPGSRCLRRRSGHNRGVPRDPSALTRALLGGVPDAVEPLVVWADRATHRVTVAGRRYVVKTDDDHEVVAREVWGQQRAAAAGVRVPEIVAVADDAFAMRWVDGVMLRDHPASESWDAAGAQVRLAHDLGGAAPFGAGFGGYESEHATWRDFFETFAARELDLCERDLALAPPDAQRIRAALRAAEPFLDTPRIGWCHGDLQPEHVLVDPETHRVVAIIDWADHGSGDVGWDAMVLTIDHASHLDAFLRGYDASADLRDALEQTRPLFSTVRLLSEATWFARHGYPTAENLRRAIELMRD